MTLKEPNLTHTFLDYFLKLPLKKKTLLEIGSGPSNLFWNKYFKTVYSYEDDNKYLTKDMILFNKDYEEDNQFKYNLNIADYIIIDNEPNRVSRYDFAYFVCKHVKDKACVVLDNSNWHTAAFNFLNSKYFNKDFPGIDKYNNYTVTSLFDIKKDKKYRFEKGMN
tara:strand:+ start:93 stop:587 length:495 start_codon:yes stop_codon:yes gene_type:complete